MIDAWGAIGGEFRGELQSSRELGRPARRTVVTENGQLNQMKTRVWVITGPAGSGKTEWLLARYCEALRTNAPGSALWLAPTWRAAAEIRQRIVEAEVRACLSPGVTTFNWLIKEVLQEAPFPVRPLDLLGKRRLVQHLIRQAAAGGRLRFFRPLAESSGLVDLICGMIGRLKQRQLWPERFRQAAEARGMSERDLELLEIYRDYQRCLRDHLLFDAEGRAFAARQMLAEGNWSRLKRLRLIVADGFSDFTSLEHDMLDALAGNERTLSISLPLEKEPCRSDLFALPRETLAELGRRHPKLIHEVLDRPKVPAWPAMAHLEARLFSDPRKSQSAPDTNGLEILAASRKLGEIQWIGSRIKRLLTVGCERSGGRPVRPDEVAVVVRSTADVEALIREAFAKLGIPVAVESSPTLQRAPLLSALAALLRLDVEDWPLRGLLGVLTSNYFRPQWPEWRDGEAVISAERAIRRLQIPQGRAALLEQLRRESRAGAEGPSTDSRSLGQLRTALQVLERLQQVLDALPQTASLREWGDAWRTLAGEIGMLRAAGLAGRQEQAPWAGSPVLSDAEGWRQLQEALQADDILYGWMRSPPPKLDRSQALAALVDILHHERAREEADQSGRVRVLSAAGARALQIPYVFFAGLAERSFPQTDTHDLPDGEELWRRSGEMLLFYQAMTRATRRLWFSYPAFDEAAQPLAASPYLDEVELACGPGHIPRTEALDLTPIPQDDEPMTAEAFRVKAVAVALEGDGGLLAGLVRRETSPWLADNVLAGLRLTHQRQSAERFGPAEGMLTGSAAKERFASDCGDERVFGATELEQYAYCPFRYFAERAVGLRPLEDLGLAVDYLLRGRTMHEAMATLHQRVNQACGGPASPATLDPQQYARVLSETVDALFERRLDGTLESAMREIDRRLWIRWIAEYRRQHEAYDRLWQDCDAPPVPTLFELSFGQANAAGPCSSERPLELKVGDETIRISGRIDRIDVGKVGGRTVFNVIDCKSGGSAKFTLDAVAEGTLLQLPLYAMAVEQLELCEPGAVPWQAGYWLIQDAGFKPKQAVRMSACVGQRLQTEPQWQELRELVARTVAALIHAMRRAEFPVYSADEECTRRCPYKTVCRIHQVRSLEKQWRPALDQV